MSQHPAENQAVGMNLDFNKTIMKHQLLHIGDILLEWSDWVTWKFVDNNHKIVPPFPGVYDVKTHHEEYSLTIGKSGNLHKRIVRGLVQGKLPHSAGKRIRNEITKEEDRATILIRWALTDRPAAAEEELHLRHRVCFGDLPRHTKKT